MSRRGEGSLFIGRLSKSTRNRDVEDVFEQYGRLTRCDIKYGAEMAYGFVDFEDRRDAEDAVKYENGRNICGSSIIVEWAKGNPRRPLGQDECYKCHRAGHWAQDCPDDRHFGYRRRRSPDVRRRSRSRDRKRRRSHSRERRYSRSRSRSPRRQRQKRSPSRSRSRSLSASPPRNGANHRQNSRSRSPSPRKASKSKSRSPGVGNSRSRSRSRS